MLSFDAVLMAGAMAVLSSRYGAHAAGLPWFVSMCFASAVNFALVALRDTYSPWLTVLGANVVYLVAHQAMSVGIDAIQGRPRVLWREASIALASSATLTLAFAATEHAAPRTTVLTAFACFWLFRCAAGLRKGPRTRDLLAARFMAAPFWLAGVAGLVHYAVLVATQTFPTTLVDRSGKGAGFALLSSLVTFAAGVGPLFVWQELRERELAEFALTDALTGLRNRRAFFDSGELLVAQHRRTKRPFSLIAIDLDHFKSINDRHGHAGGDVALRHFASVARAATRSSDLLARTGGEEFSVLLVDTDLAGATVVAERLRDQLRSTPVLTQGANVRVTCSVGVAALSAETHSLDALCALADRALYRAKESGRDSVRTAA
jgi:diguanylate cyclase (GGDEF)-like protein